MIVLNINQTNYKCFLLDLATAINTPLVHDDFLTLSHPIGQGTLKALSLFDELQVLLVDATFIDTVYTVRHRSDNRYFLLHFDDVYINDTGVFKVDGEALQKTNTYHSVVRLTSNIFENAEEIPAGMPIKCVKILFSEKWMKKYLGLNTNDDVIQKYLSLKTKSFDTEPLDEVYLKLMSELWMAKKDDPLQNIFLQNRVTLLVERFFSRLYAKLNLTKDSFELAPDVIEKMIEVEKSLSENFSSLPPSIDELSIKHAMSSTTLKKSFKTIYGDSIYAYYQKQRLQKAYELLSSGKYNVKETAEAVGFNNLSNFYVAYKKQFKTSLSAYSK